jgi:hypothetical protein
MAIRASHATTRSSQYALGAGTDLPIARIVALLLLALPIAVWLIASQVARSGPSEAAQQIASFNPRQLVADSTPHFLPKPVAAIPAEDGAGPPPQAPAEPPEGAGEMVKVANTGRVGAILRAEPRTGRQVANLRDGTVMTVLERQELSDGEWLRVKVQDGAEGWIFGRLVGPAQ